MCTPWLGKNSKRELSDCLRKALQRCSKLYRKKEASLEREVLRQAIRFRHFYTTNTIKIKCSFHSSLDHSVSSCVYRCPPRIYIHLFKVGESVHNFLQLKWASYKIHIKQKLHLNNRSSNPKKTKISLYKIQIKITNKWSILYKISIYNQKIPLLFMVLWIKTLLTRTIINVKNLVAAFWNYIRI